MTETSNLETARAFVSAWLLANYEKLGLGQLKFERLELPAKTLSIWYQTEDLMVDITVWGHAHCQDILVMEKSSNELVFSEADSCENTAGLLARLNAFSGWLTRRAAGA